MSRIYDALQAAARDQARLKATTPAEPLHLSDMDAFDESLVSLSHRIESLLPNGRGRMVAFVGVPNAVDASKLVEHFAMVVARGLNKKVLLVRTGEAVGSAVAEQETTTQTEPVIENPPVSIQCVTPGQLEGTSAAGQAEGAPRIKDRAREWRERFDWVFVDPSSADASSSADLLCSIADGVVVVVEAEKTRWQSVKDRIDGIKQQQGRVLGVILNKQRHYIPDCIYRRL